MKLSDSALLVECCHVGGEWIGAGVDPVENPATANATPYGLAAYFYARDLGRVFRVAEALEDGIVGVNTGLISTELAPFGGIKESGSGREGSRHGVEAFTDIKYTLDAGLDR